MNIRNKVRFSLGKRHVPIERENLIFINGYLFTSGRCSLPLILAMGEISKRIDVIVVLFFSSFFEIKYNIAQHDKSVILHNSVNILIRKGSSVYPFQLAFFSEDKFDTNMAT